MNENYTKWLIELANQQYKGNINQTKTAIKNPTGEKK